MNYNIHLIYVIVFVAVIYFLCKAIVKIKNPFWSSQPAFHYYDIQKWIYPKGFIDEGLPSINKFVSLKNSQIINVNDATNEQLCFFYDNIKQHFLQESTCTFIPEKKHILELLKKNNYPSYIGIYKSLPLNDVIAVISARSLSITIHATKKIGAYYVDHLCVHPGFRKKNIAPKMIQSFAYDLRRSNKQIMVGLFKREQKLNPTVPLTKYDVFGYRIDSINALCKKLSPPSHLIQIRKIQPEHTMDIWHMLKMKSTAKKIYVCSSQSFLQNLIETQLYYCYVREHKNNIEDVYFIRNSAKYYYGENSPAIEVFASIAGVNKELHVHGFIESIRRCCKELNVNRILIENIGDNNIFCNQLKKHVSQRSQFVHYPAAYYLYNYAFKKVKADDCLIIC